MSEMAQPVSSANRVNTSVFQYNTTPSNLGFVPQQPLISEELLKAAFTKNASTLLQVPFISHENPANNPSVDTNNADSAAVAAAAAVNNIGRPAVAPSTALQVPGKLQLIPPFTSIQGMARMGLVPAVPHGVFDSSSLQTSSGSSSSSPVIAPVPVGVVPAPNVQNNPTADDPARAASQFIGIEQLSPQQQSALLLTSLGLVGANATMLAQQNVFSAPLPNQQGAPLLFAEQGANTSAGFSQTQNVPAQSSALLHHVGSRHSPIRHRRMRRAAENVARSLSTANSMMRMNAAAAAGIKAEPGAAVSFSPVAASRSCVGTPSGHGIDSSKITLSLQQQPPERTVYLKILKPFPVVKLAFSEPPQSDEEKKQLTRLFVEASLIRQQSGEDISSCLEGTRMVQVIGMTAVFRKLKILCTSQQQNSNMCLRFSLFQFTSSGCEPCPSCVVTSQPIEVYSHPVYLSPDGSLYAQQQQQSIMACNGLNGSYSHQVIPARRRRPTDGSAQENTHPLAISSIVITAVVPDVLDPGDRVVVVGSGFQDQDIPNIRVLFGSTPVKPEFNDSATLLCNVPKNMVVKDPSESVQVKIINCDGTEASNTFAEVYFAKPKQKARTETVASTSA